MKPGGKRPRGFSPVLVCQTDKTTPEEPENESIQTQIVQSSLAAVSLSAFDTAQNIAQPKKNPALGGGGFKLGIVTYNIAKDWNIATIIKNCAAAGYEAVELRTTHKHGVEPTLSKAQRAEVKQRFAAAKVRLLSLGSVCEFHAPDQTV